jgi:hypothetical protein
MKPSKRTDTRNRTFGGILRKYVVGIVCLFGLVAILLVSNIYNVITASLLVESSTHVAAKLEILPKKTLPPIDIPRHTTRSFMFEGKRFLDAFVAPTPFNTSSTSAALVMPSFNLRALDGMVSRRCRFAHSNQTTNLVLYGGREVYVCAVPPEALLSSDETPTIRVSLESVRNENVTIDAALSLESVMNETVTIDAALWPWHSRANHYAVAQTCMAKNVECGKGLENENADHCFHEWIMWHRMQGISHFFIYDNNSEPSHPWLAAALTYVKQGVVTLIDWPMFLGGPGNNMAQRVQLNHAMFAFSRRVDWLGYFDVDEFFLRMQPGELNNHSELSAFDLLQQTVAESSDRGSYTSVQLQMRNAQHPETCVPNSKRNSTTQLASCDLYHSGVDGNTKIFVRVGSAGPQPINTPHQGKILASTVHFLHFARNRNHGCKGVGKGCVTDTTLAVSPPVLELERKLALMDVGDIHACEISGSPCY